MKGKKHLLLITTSFPDNQPGSEAAGSFVADFAGALSEHVDVTIVTPGRQRMADEERGNITIRRFTVPRMPLSLLSPANPVQWVWIVETLRSGRQAIEQLVSEAKVDHILALWALPSGYWAKKAWKKYGITYSTWALGSDIWSLGKIPFVRGILSRVLKDSYRCFADGYLLKEDVEKISGRSCEFLASTRKLTIEGEKSLSGAPPYRLAFLGRWHLNKGVDLLLDSLKMLGDNDWKNIEEVRICGGGPLEEAVHSACDLLEKEGRPVKLEGYLDKRAAADLMMWADYLLIPSRIESIPVVFSDAMQGRCPLIAMPVGDLPRLLSEFNVGLLAEDTTPSAFAKAIRSALSTPPVEYSGGLEQTCKQFSVEQAVNRFMHFIDPTMISNSKTGIQASSLS